MLLKRKLAKWWTSNNKLYDNCWNALVEREHYISTHVKQEILLHSSFISFSLPLLLLSFTQTFPFLVLIACFFALVMSFRNSFGIFLVSPPFICFLMGQLIFKERVHLKRSLKSGHHAERVDSFLAYMVQTTALIPWVLGV